MKAICPSPDYGAARVSQLDSTIGYPPRVSGLHVGRDVLDKEVPMRLEEIARGSAA
jgi:hypothetical protein